MVGNARSSAHCPGEKKMKKLLLLSIIFATVALPVRAARSKEPHKALKRALWQVVLYSLFYTFGIYYLEPRL